jgi:hypothetical protein
MNPSRLAAWGFIVALPFCHGIFALAFQMDANWDLRNYHYYNAYAYLTDRHDMDVLVASIPTFFNPWLDVPFFLFAETWPARALALLLGMVQGLNIVPIFGIACACLARGCRAPMLPPFVLAFLAYFGAVTLSLIGTTFYDNVVSFGSLMGLWLVVAARHRAGAADGVSRALVLVAVFLAGGLAGLCVGLKQPSAVYVAGLAAAVAVLPGARLARLARVMALGFGSLAGFVLTGGAWMATLWTRFGNPVFPFYNHIFKSPWARPESYKHVFYGPDGAGGWVVRLFAFPLAYAFDNALTSDVDFQDHRILVCYVLLLAVAGCALARRARALEGGNDETDHAFAPMTDRAAALPVLAFWAGSYALWILGFGIYRYAVGLEMLGPLVIALAWDRLPFRERWRWRGIWASIALVILTMQPANWGRVPWTAKWVDTHVPTLARPEASLVLMAGHEPYSFLIPAFPPEVRFLRIDGGFTNPAETQVRFNDIMRETVRDHAGDFYALATRQDRASAETNLAAYGLALDWDACREVRSSIGDADYVLCPAGRVR